MHGHTIVADTEVGKGAAAGRKKSVWWLMRFAHAA